MTFHELLGHRNRMIMAIADERHAPLVHCAFWDFSLEFQSQLLASGEDEMELNGHMTTTIHRRSHYIVIGVN